MTESQRNTLLTEIRDALRRLDQYLNALPNLHRDIRGLLDLATAIANDSKAIWDPIPSLRGNLQAALNQLEEQREVKE